jgi:hypothetical protein
MPYFQKLLEAPINRLDEKFLDRQRKLESLLTLGEEEFKNLMKVFGGEEEVKTQEN